jgi:hypothetical protein
LTVVQRVNVKVKVNVGWLRRVKVLVGIALLNRS